MQKIIIRRACLSDIPRLSEIVFRAKASWGYSEAFMELCRAALTITPEILKNCQIWVALKEDIIGGMIGLAHQEPDKRAEIDYFFVDPCFQKQGLGKALFSILCESCYNHGITHLDVTADPFAENIYARLGFSKTGHVASHSVPDRFLPRMTLSLTKRL